MKRRRRKKLDTSLKVIIVMGVFAALFIITMVITFWVKDAVPDTLIQYTLGAGGVEAFLLAGIKISKVLTEAKDKKKAEDICSTPIEDNPEDIR